MPPTSMRRSPVHDLLDRPGVNWASIGDAPIAISFGQPDVEAAAMTTLGLCDMSALPKLGVKGPAAASWLTEQQVEIPNTIYDTTRSPEGDLCVRLGDDEFLIESNIRPQLAPRLQDALGTARTNVYRVERQEATFLLTGSDAIKIFAQTCSINFSKTPLHRIILTRVVGVSCGILPETVADVPIYRLWVDYSFAAYLWEILAEIGHELNGSIIGAGGVYPDLLEE